MLVFSSRAAAMRVKARLDAAGIFVQAVSTPVGMGKSCGISLKVWDASRAAGAAIAEGASVYAKGPQGWVRTA